MQRIETCVISEMIIDFPLLNKIPDDIKMTAEASIKYSSESLIILLIHPDQYLLILISLEELFLMTFMQPFLGFLDEKSNEIDLPFE